jgi:hypothetical protein
VSYHSRQRIKNGVAAAIVLAAVLSLATALAASSAFAAPTLTEIPATSGEHGYPYDAVPPPSGVPGEPKLNVHERSRLRRT